MGKDLPKVIKFIPLTPWAYPGMPPKNLSNSILKDVSFFSDFHLP